MFFFKENPNIVVKPKLKIKGLFSLSIWYKIGIFGERKIKELTGRIANAPKNVWTFFCNWSKLFGQLFQSPWQLKNRSICSLFLSNHKFDKSSQKVKNERLPKLQRGQNYYKYGRVKRTDWGEPWKC